MTADRQERLIFASDFTKRDAGGIQAYRLNVNSGRTEPMHLTPEVEQPVFLAVSPAKRFLYATHAPGQRTRAWRPPGGLHFFSLASCPAPVGAILMFEPELRAAS